MPQNSNVWRPKPPRPLIPLPGQGWSLLHFPSSKVNFFRPFRYVLRFCGRVIEPKESFLLLLVGLGEYRWSIIAVIDQQWSVPVISSGQALLCGRAFTVGNGHLKPFNICKKCSPTVFLMLMSLVPLKESSIGWLISLYINLFHTINPLFFSDPSVGERWFRNKSIYVVLHWKQTSCTWKQKQSTYTDTFFCMVLVIIAVWCQNKRSHRMFLSAKNFPGKR